LICVFGSAELLIGWDCFTGVCFVIRRLVMWSCYHAVCVISALAVSKALMLET